MEQIILASASPRRQQLLNQIGIEFEVVPSGIEEVMDENLEAPQVAVSLAAQKCRDIVSRLDGDCLVIAADTIVVRNNMLLGKPKDAEDAFETLKSLSGKWHEVITGLCVYRASDKKFIEDYEITRVKMADNSDEFIRSYIATGEPFDKAGSYGIQGYGALLVEKIEGCYFNVMGLPIYKLSSILRQQGVKLLCKD